jgi:hypothetical protein
MITNIRFELYGLIDTHEMVSVHGGELRLLNIESLTQKILCHWFCRLYRGVLRSKTLANSSKAFRSDTY